jgi:integrase
MIMGTTQPIRSKNQIRELAAYFLERGEIRNHVLIVMSLNTALRICDLLRLTWDDVYDFENKRFRERVTLTEKKTRKTKVFTLNKQAIAALTAHKSSAKRGCALIASRKWSNRPISRQQAYRIIRDGAAALGFTSRVSCHSLRKTFGYLAWKAGVSPAVIMEIYNHSSLAVTQRYLGVTQDDLDDCYRTLAEEL